MYIYGWFMLIFGRKQQNSVKQLSFNLKNNFKKGLRFTISTLGMFCLFFKTFKFYRVSIVTSTFFLLNEWIWTFCPQCVYIFILCIVCLLPLFSYFFHCLIFFYLFIFCLIFLYSLYELLFCIHFLNFLPNVWAFSVYFDYYFPLNHWFLIYK